MGEFDDKSGKGFQDNWNWPAQTHHETEPPRVPDVVGKFVLVVGVGLGIYAYLAAQWGLGR